MTAHSNAVKHHRGLLALHSQDKPADDAEKHVIEAWLTRLNELKSIIDGHESALAAINQPPESTSE